MSDPTLTCPKCGHDIPITEALAGPLLEAERADFKARLVAQESELRQKAMEWKRDAEQEAARKARESAAAELRAKALEASELERRLQDMGAKLTEAQQTQADAIRRQRELEDRERELDLTVQQQVTERIAVVREAARNEAERDLKSQVSEREQTIASMQTTIEDLRRKAEQGSQQSQGEALEIELQETLSRRFPHDTFDEVPKGIRGADVLQRVGDCGLIVWECKQTKTWSPGWLPKLREDQRMVSGDIAVIVSAVLPKDVETFDAIDGVWVVHPRAAVPMATILRQTLIDVSAARAAGEGVQTKAEMVYEYLTGPQFKGRVEGIVEAFKTMQLDLDAEKRAITKQWAKREKQIGIVMQSTLGLHGDLQGIAGSSVGQVEGLETLALTEGTP